MPNARADTNYNYNAGNNSYTFPTPSQTSQQQNWQNGSYQNIQWNVPSGTSNATGTNISLVPYGSSCTNNTTNNTTSCPTTGSYTLASNQPNTGYYSGNVTTDVYGRLIPPGQYLINVYGADNSGYAPGGASNQIINIPSYNATSSPNGSNNFQISPTSGPAGTTISLIGTGLSTSTNASIMFGNGNYIGTTNNTGNSSQFTIPSYTQPCSSSNYPATSGNSSTTYTSSGTCNLNSSAVMPGTYYVKFSSNGTDYQIPFTVTEGSSTTTPGSGLSMPSNNQNMTEGALVQFSGSPTVYIYKNSQLMPFSSPLIFLSAGYNWNQVQQMPQSNYSQAQISTTPVLAENGMAIKSANNPTVYLIVNGQKSPIPSMEVFNRLGLSTNSIVVLGDQELMNYPMSLVTQS